MLNRQFCPSVVLVTAKVQMDVNFWELTVRSKIQPSYTKQIKAVHSIECKEPVAKRQKCTAPEEDQTDRGPSSCFPAVNLKLNR